MFKTPRNPEVPSVFWYFQYFSSERYTCRYPSWGPPLKFERFLVKVLLGEPFLGYPTRPVSRLLIIFLFAGGFSLGNIQWRTSTRILTSIVFTRKILKISKNGWFHWTPKGFLHIFWYLTRKWKIITNPPFYTPPPLRQNAAALTRHTFIPVHGMPETSF